MADEFRDIRARLENGQIKKFLPVPELPGVGDRIPNSIYTYGGHEAAKLSIRQKTRDDAIQRNYSFFIVKKLDPAGNEVEDLYMCTKHASNYYITTTLYWYLVLEAEKYDDENEYAEAMLNSDKWKEEDVDKTGREVWLRNVYQAVNRPIKEILKEVGMSQVKFAKYFNIPRRTVESWIYVTPPPLYMKMLLQENLGLVDRH